MALVESTEHYFNLVENVVLRMAHKKINATPNRLLMFTARYFERPQPQQTRVTIDPVLGAIFRSNLKERNCTGNAFSS